MLKNKAEINQSITIDDEALDKLSHVQGNVYIINSNDGSINTQINASALSDCLERYYKDGISFKEIVTEVKRLYLSFAVRDSVNYSQAARRIKLDRKAIEYYFYPNDRLGVFKDKKLITDGGKK